MRNVARQHFLMKDLKEILLNTHTDASEREHDVGLLPSSCHTILVDPALVPAPVVTLVPAQVLGRCTYERRYHRIQFE
eukprot:COSAG02_NODE_39601_length_415_cov_0.813291_2_plen_78_part_00